MNLADYGLEQGATVRWRRGQHGHWREFTVRGINKDGSLDLIGPYGARALMPDKIQRKDHGPKGGIVWTPLQPGAAHGTRQPDPEGVPSRPRGR